MIEDDDAVVKALRGVFAPSGERGPSRELWPEVVRRIAAPRTATSRADWALAAAAAGWLFTFPQGIAALLYLL